MVPLLIRLIHHCAFRQLLLRQLLNRLEQRSPCHQIGTLLPHLLESVDEALVTDLAESHRGLLRVLPTDSAESFDRDGMRSCRTEPTTGAFL